MEKPDVEYIEGLSPAISIDQKTTSKNPRSTVGTVTEIYDYLRLLYARIGVPHCPNCGRKISKQTIDQIVDTIMELEEGTKIQVMSPIVRGRKGEFIKLLENVQKQGFIRARIDGQIVELSDDIEMDRKKKHDIDIIVDRLIIKPEIRNRLADSVEIALTNAEDLVTININGEDQIFSRNYSCPHCNISMQELTPRMFSFNNPYGACPTCTGLGHLMKIDPDLIIPDDTQNVFNGIKAFGLNGLNVNSMAHMYYEGLAKHYNVDLAKPIKKLPKDFIQKLLYGTDAEEIEFVFSSKTGERKFKTPFEGVIPTLERRHRETTSAGMKDFYERYMSSCDCPDCNGARLKKEVLAVTVGGKSIKDFTDMPINEEKEFVNSLKLTEKEQIISEQIVKELNARLNFLCDVGLNYLTLSRSSSTLSRTEKHKE